MTTLRETTNSNHGRPYNVLPALTTVFILVLAALDIMFLMALISVG